MEIKDPIIDEIKAYCKLNDIKNVKDQILRFIKVGFDIEKFGTSPFNNFQRENEISEDIKPDTKEKQEAPKPKPTIGQEKQKIRIIKK